MSIGALAALPVVGELAKAAGDITKSVAPLIQPFADVLAKSLDNTLNKGADAQSKTVDFSSAQETTPRTLNFNG